MGPSTPPQKSGRRASKPCLVQHCWPQSKQHCLNPRNMTLPGTHGQQNPGSQTRRPGRWQAAAVLAPEEELQEEQGRQGVLAADPRPTLVVQAGHLLRHIGHPLRDVAWVRRQSCRRSGRACRGTRAPFWGACPSECDQVDGQHPQRYHGGPGRAPPALAPKSPCTVRRLCTQQAATAGQ